MKTDQEKLQAVRELIQSWKKRLAELDLEQEPHYDQDEVTADEADYHRLACCLNALEEATEQDTSAQD